MFDVGGEPHAERNGGSLGAAFEGNEFPVRAYEFPCADKGQRAAFKGRHTGTRIRNGEQQMSGIGAFGQALGTDLHHAAIGGEYRALDQQGQHIGELGAPPFITAGQVGGDEPRQAEVLGFGEAGDRFMGFQQKLVQIEPFLAVEILSVGNAPAHVADGCGKVAPGHAEGVGAAAGFGGELRLIHGADGPEQGIQRGAERFLHHPGGKGRLQGLRIRAFFRGAGCGPGGFGGPRGLRPHVGGGRFPLREVGEFKALRLGGKRGEPVERGFGNLGGPAQFQRGGSRPAVFGVPCAAVRGGERLRAWAERGEQGAQGQPGQRDEADHARRHEAFQRAGQQADDRFGEQAGEREQRQHPQRRQDADQQEASCAGELADAGREGAGQEQEHEQGPQREELQRPRIAGDQRRGGKGDAEEGQQDELHINEGGVVARPQHMPADMRQDEQGDAGREQPRHVPAADFPGGRRGQAPERLYPDGGDIERGPHAPFAAFCDPAQQTQEQQHGQCDKLGLCPQFVHKGQARRIAERGGEAGSRNAVDPDIDACLIRQRVRQGIKPFAGGAHRRSVVLAGAGQPDLRDAGKLRGDAGIQIQHEREGRSLALKIEAYPDGSRLMREGFRLVGLEFLLGVWRKDVGQRVGAFGIQQPRRLKGSGGALFVQGGGGFAGNRWEGRSRLHHRGGGRFRCRLLGHGLERLLNDGGRRRGNFRGGRRGRGIGPAGTGDQEEQQRGKERHAHTEAGMFERQERVHRRCGVRVTGRQTKGWKSLHQDTPLPYGTGTWSLSQGDNCKYAAPEPSASY